MNARQLISIALVVFAAASVNASFCDDLGSVEVGYWDTDATCDGTPDETITLNLDQVCENGFQNLECYSDGVCFAEADSCSATELTNSFNIKNTCGATIDGRFGKVISGNSLCPARPAGHKCAKFTAPTGETCRSVDFKVTRATKSDSHIWKGMSSKKTYRLNTIEMPEVFLERETTYHFYNAFNRGGDCVHTTYVSAALTNLNTDPVYTDGITGNGACDRGWWTVTPSASAPEQLSYVNGASNLAGWHLNILPAEECAPGCADAMIGDGNCDQSECYNEACGFDDGDCFDIECADGCRVGMDGDGFCDAVCDVASCNFDEGDCVDACAEGCNLDNINDGTCQPECFNEACSMDGDDCNDNQCAPGCLNEWLGDGECTLDFPGGVCYNQDCGYDLGDCADQECADGCRVGWEGDLICDIGCYNDACNFDEGDCSDVECAAGCLIEWVGDGQCTLDFPEGPCYVEDCAFDFGDCSDRECADGCRVGMDGDGNCDSVCFVAGCNMDEGDCAAQECAAGCLNEWIGDGVCDSACLNDSCGQDGGDCENGCDLIDRDAVLEGFRSFPAF